MPGVAGGLIRLAKRGRVAVREVWVCPDLAPTVGTLHDREMPTEVVWRQLNE